MIVYLLCICKRKQKQSQKQNLIFCFSYIQFLVVNSNLYNHYEFPFGLKPTQPIKLSNLGKKNVSFDDDILWNSTRPYNSVLVARKCFEYLPMKYCGMSRTLPFSCHHQKRQLWNCFYLFVSKCITTCINTLWLLVFFIFSFFHFRLNM